MTKRFEQNVLFYLFKILKFFPYFVFDVICICFWQLALLLHQQLNSSPRVPRVPRMRHAGTLPQLSSSSATSILIKRSSSSGGKDHNLVRCVVFLKFYDTMSVFSLYVVAVFGNRSV